jgi:hypothetical protein
MNIKELDPLKTLVGKNQLERLEKFLTNCNLSEQEREKLVDIIISMILTKNEPIQYLDHLG